MCSRSAIHASDIVVSRLKRAAMWTFCGSPLRRACKCSTVQCLFNAVSGSHVKE